MSPDDDARPPLDPWAPPDRAAQAAPSTGAAGRPGAWTGTAAPLSGHTPYAPPPYAPPGWGPAPWGWPAPPVDPRARRRKRLLVLGALGGVVLLLVGVLGAAVLVENRHGERVRAQVARLVPGLQAFVERARGLPFTEQVTVEVLGDDAFLAALDSGEEEPAGGDDAEPTLQALGLLAPDADLEQEVGDALDAGVVGFYDPATGRLVVRGRDVDAFMELTIVHELTHALQDQSFDIDRPELDEADDERSIAFTALVEGDATRIEEAWLAEQSPERRDEVRQYGGGRAVEDADVVDLLLAFPYVAGPAYVDRVVRAGGQPALDAAFATPPTTTEQILSGDRPAPVAVAAPTAPGTVVDQGVLGALGVALLTSEDLFVGPADDLWDGDRYVTTENAGRTCTVVHVASSDPARLRAALTKTWAPELPDATVGDGPGGTVRLESCLS